MNYLFPCGLRDSGGGLLYTVTVSTNCHLPLNNKVLFVVSSSYSLYIYNTVLNTSFAVLNYTKTM